MGDFVSLVKMDCGRDGRSGNRKKRFFASGFRLNRILRHLNSCITDLRNVLPIQPRNRKLSTILENLRDAKDDLSIEYSRLIEEEMELNEARNGNEVENVNVQPVMVESSTQTYVESSTQTDWKLI